MQISESDAVVYRSYEATEGGINKKFIESDNRKARSTLDLSQATSIVIGQNVVFALTDSNTIKSNSGVVLLTPTTISSSPSIAGNSATLTLKNSSSILTDTKLDLCHGTSEFVANIAPVHFVYTTSLNSNDAVFEGGLVTIVKDTTASKKWSGIYLNTTTPNHPTVQITSKIANNDKFYTNLPVSIPSAATTLLGYQGCRFTFASKFIGSGSLTFTNGCSASFYNLNMQGGSVNYNAANMDLSGGGNTVTNTIININSYSTVVIYQQRPWALPWSSPIGSLQLDDTAQVNFVDPSTTSLYLQYNNNLAGRAPNVQFSLIVSNGGINCNGMYRSRNKTVVPGQQLRVLVFPNDVSAAYQTQYDAISLCTPESFSARLFYKATTYPEAVKWDTCEIGQVKCRLGGCAPVGTCPESCAPGMLPPPGNTNALANCWDGSCAFGAELCPPFPACPTTLPVRCDGYCAPLGSTCDACAFPCPSGCRASATDVCLPYNGCPSNQIQCPNNFACVSDESQCAAHGTSTLPFSRRVIPSYTDIYTNHNSPVVVWRDDPYSTNNTISGIYASFPPGTALGQAVFLTVRSVPDSIAITAGGLAVSSTFNYYKSLLTAPIQFVFGVGSANLALYDSPTFVVPVSIFFAAPALPSTDYCVAIINASNQWECISTPLVSHKSGSYIEAKFTVLPTAFALIKTI
ncbi:hypothetical protein DFA_00418 [Cavenderia fasciculata]|uniref:Uncharacterized protein n=1 Tax=Cavenderia fasciculata TaxID=261658 RepID=F4PRQ8_CACFS|nr:uncharacterized protein DFA_00418 [Cavenderia fasciculata]EGG20557.1 hypothetical protein DFA_00418 [Cavenderia fasciculata]|eukprot:XP_004358407.1 hypothetical protein DFA_00418 [Cavenderia fasciculata]